MMRRIRAEGEKQAEFEELIVDASICHFRFGDNGSSWWCRAVPDLKRELSDFVPINPEGREMLRKNRLVIWSRNRDRTGPCAGHQ